MYLGRKESDQLVTIISSYFETPSPANDMNLVKLLDNVYPHLNDSKMVTNVVTMKEMLILTFLVQNTFQYIPLAQL